MIEENKSYMDSLIATTRDGLSQSKVESANGAFKGLLNAATETDNTSKIDEVAKDFEAVFITQMIQHMNEGLEPDPLFGGGNAEQTFRGLLFNEYGKSIASAGGLGLSTQVKKELLKLQEV